MSKSKRIAAPFTNKFGHTLNPGDSAIAITSCTGRTCIARVEYVGYVERMDYYYGYGLDKTPVRPPNKYVQIRRPTILGDYYNKHTGEKVRWNHPDGEYRTHEGFMITTLQNNNILPDNVRVDTLIEAV